MSFSFNIIKKAGYNIVNLQGRLVEPGMANDLLTSITELIDQGHNHLIIDMLELSHMNSTGLNLMVNVLTKCRNTGGEVIVVHINEKINQLLIITKLNSVFTVTENIDEAIQALDSIKQENQVL